MFNADTVRWHEVKVTVRSDVVPQAPSANECRVRRLQNGSSIARQGWHAPLSFTTTAQFLSLTLSSNNFTDRQFRKSNFTGGVVLVRCKVGGIRSYMHVQFIVIANSVALWYLQDIVETKTAHARRRVRVVPTAFHVSWNKVSDPRGPPSVANG